MSFSCRIRQCFCSSTIRFEHVFFINKQFNKFAHVQMLSRMSSLSGRIILELSPFVFSLLVYSKSSTCYLLFVCNTSDQGITVRVIDGYRHHEPFLGYINDCRPIGGGEESENRHNELTGYTQTLSWCLGSMTHDSNPY